MIDFNLIIGFEWDEGNSRKSVDHHGVSQAEAEQMFFAGPLIVVDDLRLAEKVDANNRQAQEPLTGRGN